ncbi:MAG TPA: hypothetical protein VG603_14535, partial [Chitinophagales bacterium]|nr:hypothetical protein [Chitinophagales bacterium]
MKNTAALMLCLAAAIAVQPLKAQGWNQDKTGIYSIGVGGAGVIALGPFPAYVTGSGLSVNVSGEYRVQRFIGVGFETGMDVFVGHYYRAGYYYAGYAAIGIPIAAKCNVHILEAANVPIANKLDVYAGLNLGGGPAFYTGPGGGVFGFLEVGPQFGVRYWFNPNVAVFGEFGWGATFA